MIDQKNLTEIDCPECGGYWYEDLDETGTPYTCFLCCNGTEKVYKDDADNIWY